MAQMRARYSVRAWHVLRWVVTEENDILAEEEKNLLLQIFSQPLLARHGMKLDPSTIRTEILDRAFEKLAREGIVEQIRA